MAQLLETESIVLRSIRYGEADRILHLYTPGHGRVSAIAKGARKTKSRFGARLEPFTRVDMVLRTGRGDLMTVSAVQTIAPLSRLRTSAAALDWSARACDAVSRLFDGPDPHPEAYNLLANGLAMVNEDTSLADKATQISFRLKLLVAAGLQPQLSACAGCGAEDDLVAFSGSAGGVVCSGCNTDGFPLGSEAWGFLVSSLGRPLAEAGPAGTTALRQAERSVNETVEHHANVRLRPASAR
jgi:DNA repair protein RecO (recombination protein O)